MTVEDYSEHEIEEDINAIDWDFAYTNEILKVEEGKKQEKARKFEEEKKKMEEELRSKYEQENQKNYEDIMRQMEEKQK